MSEYTYDNQQLLDWLKLEGQPTFEQLIAAFRPLLHEEDYVVMDFSHDNNLFGVDIMWNHHDGPIPEVNTEHEDPRSAFMLAMHLYLWRRPPAQDYADFLTFLGKPVQS